MPRNGTATAQRRVVVECPNCLTVATLYPSSVPVWRLNHQLRCSRSRASDNWPQSVIDAELQRAGANATTSALVGGGAAASAPSSHPVCAECGTDLTPHEAARTDAGKFTLLCGDCTRLALGLL